MKIAILILIASFAVTTTSFAFQTTATQTESEATTDETQVTESTWVKVAPSSARASIEMPIKPRYVQRKFVPVKGQPEITVNLHIATVKGSGTTMVFGYNDLTVKPKTRSDIDKVLEGAIRGSVTNVLGQLSDENPVKAIKYGNHLGRQFVYACINSGQEFVCMSRVFVVEDRQYQITAIMGATVFDESVAARFLNSFRLEKPKAETTEDGKEASDQANGDAVKTDGSN